MSALIASPIGDTDCPRPVGETSPYVLQFCRMGQTITVRLKKDLAEWLEEVAARTGVSQGQIVRDESATVGAEGSEKGFLRLAGTVRGPRDLSTRKGFARQ